MKNAFVRAQKQSQFDPSVRFGSSHKKTGNITGQIERTIS